MASHKGLPHSILLKRLTEKCQDFPPDVTAMALELVLDNLRLALTAGQPVTLRGFGRLIPRKYHGQTRKRFGLLFHASPKLSRRLNAKTAWPPDFPDR
ncbi:MAG: hypothetical protein LBF38_08880 [Deltaproteobacteria bacterium]|jgi:hypothetical protein|nr:hypothetical protein [Deltaproteobacteria bacterium]